MEEQRERREKEKLEALKKKDKHEQSAVASSEVKQRLQVRDRRGGLEGDILDSGINNLVLIKLRHF